MNGYAVGARLSHLNGGSGCAGVPKDVSGIVSCRKGYVSAARGGIGKQVGGSRSVHGYHDAIGAGGDAVANAAVVGGGSGRRYVDGWGGIAGRPEVGIGRIGKVSGGSNPIGFKIGTSANYSIVFLKKWSQSPCTVGH